MTFKVADLTKKSKWKLTKDVNCYKVKVVYSWGVHGIEPEPITASSGTEFIVPDKRLSTTFSDNHYDKEKQEYVKTYEVSGVYYFVKVDGATCIVFFNDIKDCIELVEQPKDLAIVIKDITTGMYYVDSTRKIKIYDERLRNEAYQLRYSGASLEVFNKKLNESCLGYDYDKKKSEHIVEYEDVAFKLSGTPLSGKVFKNIGFAKQRLLMTVGYYNDTDNDMMKTSTPVSTIPESWKIVEYDRVTKTETVLDFDCTEYVKHALELKGLTTKYGTATRSLYKKLEGKGILDQYKHFLIFTPGDVDSTELSKLMNSSNNLLEEKEEDYNLKQMYNGATYIIKKDEVKIVKGLLDKNMKKEFSNDSICIAIEDRYQALELTFTYYGNLSFKLIDMCTLKEVVKEEEHG